MNAHLAMLLSVLVLSCGSARAEIRDVAAAARRLEGSVVMLQWGSPTDLNSNNCPTSYGGRGAAVVVGKGLEGDWLLATAKHVVHSTAAQKQLYARLKDGRCEVVTKQPLGDDATDLGFFSLPTSIRAGDGSEPVAITIGKIANASDLGHDRKVYAMGWGDDPWEMKASGGEAQSVTPLADGFQLNYILPSVREGYSGGPVINSCGQLVGIILNGAQGNSAALTATSLVSALRRVLRVRADSVKEDVVCVNVNPEPYRIADNALRVGFSISIPGDVQMVRQYTERLRKEYLRGDSRVAPDLGEVFRYPAIGASSPLFPGGSPNATGPQEELTRRLLSSIEVRVYCYDRAQTVALLAGGHEGKLYPDPQFSLRLRPRIDAAAGDQRAAFLVYAGGSNRLIVHRADYEVPINDIGREVQYATDLLGGACFMPFGLVSSPGDEGRRLLDEAMALSNLCLRIAINSAVNVRIFPIETVGSPNGSGDVHMGRFPRTPDSFKAGQFWRACDM